MFPKKPSPTLASTEFEKRSNLSSPTTLTCLRNPLLEGPHWSSSFQISGIKDLPNPSFPKQHLFELPVTNYSNSSKQQTCCCSKWRMVLRVFTVNFLLRFAGNPPQTKASKTRKFSPRCHWQTPHPLVDRRGGAERLLSKASCRQDTWNPSDSKGVMK